MGQKSKVYHANLLKLYVEREPDPEEVIRGAAVTEDDYTFENEDVLDLGDVCHEEGVRDVKMGKQLSASQVVELRS